jgi:hypothetical protein
MTMFFARLESHRLSSRKPGLDHLSRWHHHPTGRTLYVSEPFRDAFTLADVESYAQTHGFRGIALASDQRPCF